VVLLASYFFYGWWDYRFCGLMLFASLLDYAIGWQISRTRIPRKRRFWLAVTLASNLGLLGFFKYFNFFADSFALWAAAAGLNVSTTTLNIVLPIGISFYTFQTLSYTIDIYRGSFQPRGDVIEYLAFVSFFPQLVAGPIERASDLLPQFSKQRFFKYEAAVEGCRLMLWGFIKKMVFADNLGLIADQIFGRASTASGAELAFGTACFAFQIYCDFSGYSDIAVGTANLFGIRLSRNFAYPYFSQSCTEFWRRWHISLSRWFRDYVFIPLGGSRGSRRQTFGNVMSTMLLSGLWHGAAWHFVSWGALHGFYLASYPFQRPAGPGAAITKLPGGDAFAPSA
jgi:D-alanyl-lipoteichoic acid acyltransferase DltB (MBOAT superfamily)